MTLLKFVAAVGAAGVAAAVAVRAAPKDACAFAAAVAAARAVATAAVVAVAMGAFVEVAATMLDFLLATVLLLLLLLMLLLLFLLCCASFRRARDFCKREVLQYVCMCTCVWVRIVYCLKLHPAYPATPVCPGISVSALTCALNKIGGVVAMVSVNT